MSFRKRIAGILAGLSLGVGGPLCTAKNSPQNLPLTSIDLPSLRLDIYLSALRQADPVEYAFSYRARHPSLKDYLGYAYGAHKVPDILSEVEKYRQKNPELYFASNYSSHRFDKSAPRGFTHDICGSSLPGAIMLSPDPRLRQHLAPMLAQHETHHWASQDCYGWSAVYSSATREQYNDIRSMRTAIREMPAYYIPTIRFPVVADAPPGAGIFKTVPENHISEGIPELGTYLLHPSEMEVRLAEIKRLYAIMSGGEIIRTPEDALRACLKLGFNIDKKAAEEILAKNKIEVCPDAYHTPAWPPETLRKFYEAFPDVHLLRALFNGEQGHYTILDAVDDNEPLDLPPASTQPSLHQLLIKCLLLKTPGVAAAHIPSNIAFG